LNISLVIAKRGVNLGKSYTILGCVLGIFSIFVPNVLPLIAKISSIPSTTPNSTPEVLTVLPLLSLPLMVFSTLTISTPVLLLYVYDKNNGVLEYLLSLGMDLGDVFKSYLQGSITLAAIALLVEIPLNFLFGSYFGTNESLLLAETALAPVLALSIVAFVSIIMMSFSSLQKERIGANQPLGLGAGALLAIPSYIIPLVLPAIAIPAEFFLSGFVALLFGAMYLVAGRFIKREKLLP
jgi:hypothetical protein